MNAAVSSVCVWLKFHRATRLTFDPMLPYGGDLNAAMRAQDRDAIRLLMAARADADDGNAAPTATHDEDVSCPICHELLYKPTVNACGHAFCFWCIHQSMDALDASHCVRVPSATKI